MTALKHRLPERLSTERLVLVTPDLTHVPRIAALANNERVHRVMSRLPFPYSEDDALFFINEVVPDPQEKCFAITLGGQFIGVVGLSMGPDTAPELGYWLGEAYWNHGYATEAARAVIAAAKEAGATSLKSRALMSNAPSRNVLKKLGFIEIGEGTDQQGTLMGQSIMFMRLELDRE
ncbi:hypothetical protein ASG47_07350 [Devosia sp. Leaf420]|uniref:GNAT family N-acetyltransferase n=1 Tax=Devosia sp. Leaf420 TaxID=1736374 RepID=UPI000713F346|nr:GNAT family N-acetyltransferase [Devosia sp. Leaf420]KQT48178.1 hypothetical protein ASG47_07350 [Devosia sp. Leaf420]